VRKNTASGLIAFDVSPASDGLGLALKPLKRPPTPSTHTGSSSTERSDQQEMRDELKALRAEWNACARKSSSRRARQLRMFAARRRLTSEDKRGAKHSAVAAANVARPTVRRFPGSLPW